MIERIIVPLLTIAGIIAFVVEVAGGRISKIFCSHPPEQVGWNGGARMCRRCGKEVTLWE